MWKHYRTMRNLNTRSCPWYRYNENSLFRLIMNSKANDPLHQLVGMFSYPVVLLASTLASNFNDADEVWFLNFTATHYKDATHWCQCSQDHQQLLVRFSVKSIRKLCPSHHAHQMLSNMSIETEIIVHDVKQSHSTTLVIGKCTHLYSNLTTKQKLFIVYPNFGLKNRTKGFMAQSFDSGKYIFINGHQTYSRDLLLLFESDIVELRASFMGFADTLNYFSDRRSPSRVKIDRGYLFLACNRFNLICLWDNR